MLPKSAQKNFQGHLKSKSSSKNTPKMRNFEVQFCPWKCGFCHFHTFLALACVWRLALLWINVRWIALISEKILSTKKVTRKSVKKIFGVVWNQKIHRKTAKVWNFKSLLWAWKSGFCSFHTFLVSRLRLTYRIATKQRALDSSDLVEDVRYPECE